MTDKTIDYCSLEPVFPTSAYMLFLFVMHQNEQLGLVPLEAIYETKEAAAQAVDTLMKEISQTQHVTIPEESLLIPITFQERYSMEKSFWEKPTLSYDQHARIKTFNQVAYHPELYSLLVTPYAYDDATAMWHLQATLPFLPEKNHSIIETFMRTSDQVVEPRAKHSAIYTFGKKIRFNWRTQETKEIEQSIDELLGSQN